MDGGLLRFYDATAPLLFMDEIVGRLETMVAELIESRDAAVRRAEDDSRRAEDDSRRAEDESRRAEDDSRRAGDEARRADALAREVAALRTELERAKRGG